MSNSVLRVVAACSLLAASGACTAHDGLGATPDAKERDGAGQSMGGDGGRSRQDGDHATDASPATEPTDDAGHGDRGAGDARSADDAGDSADDAGDSADDAGDGGSTQSGHHHQDPSDGEADDPADAGYLVRAIPADLWKPPGGSTPATGNYVYLEFAPEPYLYSTRPDGEVDLYTQADTRFTVSGRAEINVAIESDSPVAVVFDAPRGFDALTVGYYPELKEDRPEDGSPSIRLIDLVGSCDSPSAWFAIDGIEHESDAVTALDARFEYACTDGRFLVHGAIHWRPNDPTLPAGPTEIPSNLWQPPPDVTLATGNYVYLESEAGDVLGAGETLTYTNGITFDGDLLGFGINGADWQGVFVGMAGIGQLVSGYYGDLMPLPFLNPVKAGLRWSVQGRDCGSLSGAWFAIDAIAFEDGAPRSVDLRFEEHCTGATGALHGAIHWTADLTSGN